MRSLCGWLSVCLVPLAVSSGAFAQSERPAKAMAEAIELVSPVMAEVAPLLTQGKLSEANTRILAVFREPRTPEQQLVLGNILFRQDIPTAYQLHKAACAGMPSSDEALFEWALEQHRAREWQGAADCYRRFTAKHPGYAVAYGLLAECLLRLGQVAESCAAWQSSEDAATGTLESFETMVCEVHFGASPDAQRAALITGMRDGDVARAAELICLDAAWKVDWWNTSLNEDYLSHDAGLVRAQNFTPSRGLDAVLCAAEVAALDQPTQVQRALLQHGFIMDAQATIPERGDVLALLLNCTIRSGVMDRATARKVLGEKILATAKSGKDAAFYNAAAYLFLDEPVQLAAIDLAAWDATGDESFAASRIAGLAASGTLTSETPVLVRALKEFPDSGIIQGAALAVHPSKSGASRAERLVAAIKAEYCGFSPSGLLGRPDASTLARLFDELQDLQRAK